MPAIPDYFSQLQQRLNDFARARDWEQFHSPKNLSMALIAEAAELIEHFQWLTQDESRELDADNVHLAGSGPTMFTLAQDKNQGEAIYHNLVKEGFEAYLVQSLATR